MDKIKLQQNLSDINNRRRRNVSDSPEFEFWMVRNPTLPQLNIVSADELFHNGVLLPLNQHSDISTGSKQPGLSTGSTTGSKRWKDIWFKKTNHEDNKLEKTKNEKINNNKSSTTTTQSRATSSIELNIINIWPFSRSKSAGNDGSRPRTVAGARKASSAPCSRSNSAGDPKGRKLEKCPSRSGGVHLRRPTVVRKIPAAGAGKSEALNVNVPICMGHRHRLSGCKSDQMNVGAGGGDGGRLFHFRSLFATKVY